MKRIEHSETQEKHGFLTGEPHFCESGISKKTNKPYDAFAFMKFLPLNCEETISVGIDLNFLDEIKETISDMMYLQRIVIIGEVGTDGRFLATEVRPYAN